MKSVCECGSPHLSPSDAVLNIMDFEGGARVKSEFALRQTSVALCLFFRFTLSANYRTKTDGRIRLQNNDSYRIENHKKHVSQVWHCVFILSMQDTQDNVFMHLLVAIPMTQVLKRKREKHQCGPRTVIVSVASLGDPLM